MRPEELAADLRGLVDFLREHSGDFDHDDTLRAAAAVFLGNALVRLRSDGRWQRIGEDAGAGDDEMSPVVEEAVDSVRTASDEQVQDFLAVVEDWASREPLPPTLEAPDPAPLPVSRAPYVRPPLPARSYRTPEGGPVAYGNRRGVEGPPEDAYEVVTHPERFAGLHRVAGALVEHLVAVYDVEVETGVSCAADLLWRPSDVVAATRLVPRRPDAAPLTIVRTGLPGVTVHAGALQDAVFPVCGCDETAESEAEELEQFVLAVAAGSFAERYPVGSQRWYECAWTAPDRSSSSPGRDDPPASAWL